MDYQWKATLLLVAVVLGLSLIARLIIFSSSAMRSVRVYNQEKDSDKKQSDRYKPILMANDRIALACYLAFLLGIAPFIITVSVDSAWNIVVDILLIIFIYDLLYYVTHRFLFHGNGYFRRIHALHHQARSPTLIDARYVHPLELFIGIALFIVTASLVGFLNGPVNVLSLAISFLIFVHVNLLNHTHVDLPYFPYKTLTWISEKHAIHHENMHRGNFATITLFYDKLFGTYE
jgi:sterol desaturase/sphingolipid hydroxylase (fatty acid hydroxylase superfamily)